MVQKTRILLVDDDVNICELLRLYLDKEGYEVSMLYSGTHVMDTIAQIVPNLVLLDIMLPGNDGWSLCREIRKIGTIPIIMLTARGDTFDKVLGLELGADDYIVKPFDTKEVIARIKAVLRRYDGGLTEQNELAFDTLVINRNHYTVSIAGETVDMPPKEFELLFYLASNINNVFTRDQILEHVWGIDFFGDTRTVDVHIKRLREKVERPGCDWQIRTVWGVGYKFEMKQGT